MRLVKEVLLQKYLESWCRVTKVVSFFNWRGRCSAANNLGQLVTDDIYNCYAIYCVQQLNANFEYGQRPKLGPNHLLD